MEINRFFENKNAVVLRRLLVIEQLSAIGRDSRNKSKPRFEARPVFHQDF